MLAAVPTPALQHCIAALRAVHWVYGRTHGNATVDAILGTKTQVAAHAAPYPHVHKSVKTLGTFDAVSGFCLGLYDSTWFRLRWLGVKCAVFGFLLWLATSIMLLELWASSHQADRLLGVQIQSLGLVGVDP